MDRYTVSLNTRTGECTISKNGAHMLKGKFEGIETFLKKGYILFIEMEGADTYYRKEGK